MLGWNNNQWARVMALHNGPAPKSIADAMRIRKQYLDTYQFSPEKESSIIGSDTMMNWEGARRVMSLPSVAFTDYTRT